MPFTKIKETIAAFRTRPTVDLQKKMQESMAAYEKSIRDASSGQKALKATLRVGVILAVLVPTAMVISQMLHQVTRFQGEALGTLGFIMGAVIAWAINTVHTEIVKQIPFHKLNPFFGNKIEETIRAFKHS